MDVHDPQTPQGSGVGPFSQFKERAMMRAVVVLPVPRIPVKIKAWPRRFPSRPLLKVSTRKSCPITSSSLDGRYLRAKTRYPSKGEALGSSDTSLRTDVVTIVAVIYW